MSATRDAATLDAADADGGIWMDAGPRPPEPLPLEISIAIGDGGYLRLGDGGLVPIVAAFEIRVPFRAPGLRARLESSGHAVESRDRVEVGVGTTTYRLIPDEPLEPGTSHVLEVGPNAATRELGDGSGRTFLDARIPVITAGEKARPKVKKRPRRRSK